MDNRLDAKLEWLASQIVLRRLEVPATLFLEMHRPLNTVFHTLVLGLFPLVSPFVGGNRFHEFEQLLQLFEVEVRFRRFVAV